jgi:predicted phosphodiesterase
MLIVGSVLFSVIASIVYIDWNGMMNPGTPFSVSAAGDWGCGDAAKNTVMNIKSKNPAVILALGDLSYEESKSTFPYTACPDTISWFKMMSPIEKNLKFVIGNHDLATTAVPDLSKKYFDGMPSPYSYSFNKNNIHFLIMDSESPFDKDSDQYKRVNNDLKAAASDPSIHWIIVAYHSARYASSALYRCFTSALAHIRSQRISSWIFIIHFLTNIE